jgi:DNA polymerase-3 subunit epsilon
MILGLDFETTWQLNTKLTRPLEIGAVLLDETTNKVMAMQSDFLFDDSHPVSPKELVDLTGITDDMRKEYGILPKEGFKKLHSLMEKADYIVAHNGNMFDKPIYLEECERLGLAPVEKHWIDTKTDVPYRKDIKSSKLTHLCAEHGFVNPFAHRALFDSLSMLKLLSFYNFQEILELSKEETFEVTATVDYSRRNEAKNLGYYWNGEEKKWQKQMKKRFLEQEKEQVTFPIQIRLLQK